MEKQRPYRKRKVPDETLLDTTDTELSSDAATDVDNAQLHHAKRKRKCQESGQDSGSGSGLGSGSGSGAGVGAETGHDPSADSGSGSGSGSNSNSGSGSGSGSGSDTASDQGTAPAPLPPPSPPPSIPKDPKVHAALLFLKDKCEESAKKYSASHPNDTWYHQFHELTLEMPKPKTTGRYARLWGQRQAPDDDRCCFAIVNLVTNNVYKPSKTGVIEIRKADVKGNLFDDEGGTGRLNPHGGGFLKMNESSNPYRKPVKKPETALVPHPETFLGQVFTYSLSSYSPATAVRVVGFNKLKKRVRIQPVPVLQTRNIGFGGSVKIDVSWLHTNPIRAISAAEIRMMDLVPLRISTKALPLLRQEKSHMKQLLENSTVRMGLRVGEAMRGGADIGAGPGPGPSVAVRGRDENEVKRLQDEERQDKDDDAPKASSVFLAFNGHHWHWEPFPENFNASWREYG